MRVAYISADQGVAVAGNSGSGVHVREFISALQSRGHEIKLLTARPPAPGERGLLPCDTVDLCDDAFLAKLKREIAKQLDRVAFTAAPPAMGKAMDRAPRHGSCGSPGPVEGASSRLGPGVMTRAHNGHEETSSPVISELYGLLLNQSLFNELQCMAGDIDAIYERQSLWSYAGLQFAKRHGIPYFLELNAPLIEQQLDYRKLEMVEAARAVESTLLAGADRVLVNSCPLAAYAAARGASQRRIRVLSCGVATRILDHPSVAARLAKQGGPVSRGSFVLGFTGSLKVWHGLDLLLRAFRRLYAEDPSYRLLIVGDGPLRATLESECRQYGVASVVEFSGDVPHADIPLYLSRMDVGIAAYPPIEQFYFSPLKVWEYAAAAVPIIASEQGDLGTLFPHKNAALLHPPGSVRKIVSHVRLLRSDPGLARRITRRARRIARARSWDRLAGRFESMAEPLIAPAHAAK